MRSLTDSTFSISVRRKTKSLRYFYIFQSLTFQSYVSQDRLINVGAFSTDLPKEGIVFEGSTTISTREVLSLFEGWEEVQAHLSVSHNCHQTVCQLTPFYKCIKRTKWVIPTLNPLDRYASGRVILAGDAVSVLFRFCHSLLSFHVSSSRRRSRAGNRGI